MNNYLTSDVKSHGLFKHIIYILLYDYSQKTVNFYKRDSSKFFLLKILGISACI